MSDIKKVFKSLETLINIRNKNYKHESLSLTITIEDNYKIVITGHNAAIVVGSMYSLLVPMVVSHMRIDNEDKITLWV